MDTSDRAPLVILSEAKDLRETQDQELGIRNKSLRQGVFART